MPSSSRATKNGALRQAMRAMDTNIALMHQNAHPTLMVSYEKAIQKPAPFVRALALFLGIEPTAQAIDAALGQIQPGGYLQELRGDGLYGLADQHSPPAASDPW